MTINYVRVINAQVIPQGISRNGSILIDKIDRSQGNNSSPPYAQIAKQKIYIPYSNPLDSSVPGYIDLVPTDDVLLASLPDGSIGGLANSIPACVSISTIASDLLAKSHVSSANYDAGTTDLTITGTTFLSVDPDVTYVDLVNASGVRQHIAEVNFTSIAGTQIVIPLSAITIGTPSTSWTLTVFANSKRSNSVHLTTS
jgi:hypothetical protein